MKTQQYKLFKKSMLSNQEVIVKGSNVIVKSDKPIKTFSIDVCFMFDLLASSTSVNSTRLGVRRRARLLNGLEAYANEPGIYHRIPNDHRTTIRV